MDYEQQEFGIAAALSGDGAMMAAYASGDPYLAFARQAGAVPPGATKETHREARERFKVCALGIQYGMGGRGRSRRLCESQPGQARELIANHRAVYRRYWDWSRAMEREARADGHDANRCSAGGSTYGGTPSRAPSGTSPCRPTGRRS